MPTDPQRYANAAKAVLTLVGTPEYGNTVTSFEVWNEPNFRGDSGSDGVALTPAEYSNILATTYAVVKPTHPTIQILGGSLAGTDVNYLLGMYQAGAKHSFDVLSIHPYTYGNTLSPDDCSNPRWSYRCGVEDLRAAMIAPPWNDTRPIWFTEFGWSSYTGTVDPRGVTEDQQQRYLARAIRIIGERNWNYVHAALWYNLVDCTERNPDRCNTTPPQTPPDPSMAYFGLYSYQRDPKPVRASFTLIPPLPPIASAIAGNRDAGVHLLASHSGTYTLTIIGGVYSPWPTDQGANNQWRSIVFGYRNRPIQWGIQPNGLRQPTTPDVELGHWEQPNETEAEALSHAIGVSTTISLQAGDTLTLVPIDQQGIYAGNRSAVQLQIQQPIPPFGPLPQFLFRPITIAGTDDRGPLLIPTSQGTYTFTTTDGVYSPWSTNQGATNQWRSVLSGYKNRPIEWGRTASGLIEPLNPDLSFGHWDQPNETEAQALIAARGLATTTQLDAGDTLTLVPIDQQSTYPGNRGWTQFRIQFTP